MAVFEDGNGQADAVFQHPFGEDVFHGGLSSSPSFDRRDVDGRIRFANPEEFFQPPFQPGGL